MVSVMKTFLLAFIMCIGIGITAVAQNALSLSSPKNQAANARLISMLGAVRADGEKLTFVTDLRTWNVDNPEILRGHEGHYLRVYAHVYSENGWIHITEVKMPTTTESRIYDER